MTPNIILETVPLNRLKPWPKNPRKSHAVEAIARSIESFGYLSPIVVQAKTYRILAGHGRLEALAKVGAKEIPVVVADIDDDKADLYTIADNKLTEAAEWDFGKMAHLLLEFDTKNLDTTLTGFDSEELERIANWTLPTEGEETEPVPEPPVEAISKPGDLWELGKHRILCGDSTKAEDVARLMGKNRAGLMNTDPPYGVAYANDDRPNPGVTKPRVAKPRVAKDEMRDKKLQVFLESAFRIAASNVLKADAAWYLWHAYLTQGFFAAAAAAAANVILSRQIIWVKPVFLLTRGQYHWKHEPCFFGWVEGNQPPDYGRGNGERDQTTIWEIAGVTQAERKEFNHSTPKPVALFEIPIVKHLKSGEICYEPFAGSGPQIIAAEKLGRRCYAVEIEPRYVDVAVRRWQNFTKKQAKNITRPEVTIPC